MAKSLEARLDGSKDEFLHDVEWYGRSVALDMWSDKLDGYKSWTGLCRFLEKETGNPNFGLVPKVDMGNSGDAFDKFVFALRKRFVEEDSELRRLRTENEVLKAELQLRKIQDSQRAVIALEGLNI